MRRARTMRVGVAGGTGLIGKLVVAGLRAQGHEPVVMARATGVDLVSGAGLDQALVGCSAVIDVMNRTTVNGSAAREFFGTTSQNLIDSGRRNDVNHVVALSIIGVDRVPLGYYSGKVRQEEVLSNGALPWTVLRAAQFHEFPEQAFARARGPVALVPTMLSRPVAAREVAAELIRLASGEARGRATEIAGPEPLLMSEMTRRLFLAQGRRRLVLPVRLPGAAGKAMATGGLLPSGDFVAGVQTYAEYLAEHVRSS